MRKELFRYLEPCLSFILTAALVCVPDAGPVSVSQAAIKSLSANNLSTYLSDKETPGDVSPTDFLPPPEPLQPHEIFRKERHLASESMCDSETFKKLCFSTIKQLQQMLTEHAAVLYFDSRVSEEQKTEVKNYLKEIAEKGFSLARNLDSSYEFAVGVPEFSDQNTVVPLVIIDGGAFFKNENEVNGDGLELTTEEKNAMKIRPIVTVHIVDIHELDESGFPVETYPVTVIAKNANPDNLQGQLVDRYPHGAVIWSWLVAQLPNYLDTIQFIIIDAKSVSKNEEIDSVLSLLYTKLSRGIITRSMGLGNINSFDKIGENAEKHGFVFYAGAGNNQTTYHGTIPHLFPVGGVDQIQNQDGSFTVALADITNVFEGQRNLSESDHSQVNRYYIWKNVILGFRTTDQGLAVDCYPFFGGASMATPDQASKTLTAAIDALRRGEDIDIQKIALEETAASTKFTDTYAISNTTNFTVTLSPRLFTEVANAYQLDTTAVIGKEISTVQARWKKEVSGSVLANLGLDPRNTSPGTHSFSSGDISVKQIEAFSQSYSPGLSFVLTLSSGEIITIETDPIKVGSYNPDTLLFKLPQDDHKNTIAGTAIIGKGVFQVSDTAFDQNNPISQCDPFPYHTFLPFLTR